MLDLNFWPLPLQALDQLIRIVRNMVWIDIVVKTFLLFENYWTENHIKEKMKRTAGKNIVEPLWREKRRLGDIMFRPSHDSCHVTYELKVE